MAKDLLDFENENREKGYVDLPISRQNLKDNIGKQICYVDFVEPHRGTYFVRYGIIHSVKRNQLYLNNGEKSVPISKIQQIGVRISE